MANCTMCDQPISGKALICPYCRRKTSYADEQDSLMRAVMHDREERRLREDYFRKPNWYEKLNLIAFIVLAIAFGFALFTF